MIPFYKLQSLLLSSADLRKKKTNNRFYKLYQERRSERSLARTSISVFYFCEEHCSSAKNNKGNQRRTLRNAMATLKIIKTCIKIAREPSRGNFLANLEINLELSLTT